MPTEKRPVSIALLQLTIGSQLTDARFAQICAEIDRAATTARRIRLVLMMHAYPSFNSAEDLLDDLRFLRRYEQVIDKVAVVSARPQNETWVGLFGLFSGISMTFFHPDQKDDLTRWAQA